MILDAEATVDKAVDLLTRRPTTASQLAVLPETFVSLYPSGTLGARGGDASRGFDELWERMWASSVDVPGPLVDRLAAACAERDICCAIGVNERESERPGSLYNAMLTIGPQGLLAKHRKLMPTQHERLFHGIGAGDDLHVVDTPLGRDRRPDLLGEPDAAGPLRGLPAGPADLGRADRRRLRRLAREHAPHRDRVGRVRRLGAAVHPALGLPGRLPGRSCPTRRCSATAARRSSSRDGEVIAGPLYGEEGMVVADCDLRVGLHAKRWFDAVGHYGREDVLLPAATLTTFQWQSQSRSNPTAARISGVRRTRSRRRRRAPARTAARRACRTVSARAAAPTPAAKSSRPTLTSPASSRRA